MGKVYSSGVFLSSGKRLKAEIRMEKRERIRNAIFIKNKAQK
jgi:hypothetical protein